MIQSPDSEFENENDSQEEVIEVQENIIEALPEDKSLVVSEDVFPDSLLIVPLYDRPLFPKMLLPVIISEEKLEKVLLKELRVPSAMLGWFTAMNLKMILTLMNLVLQKIYRR